MENSIELNSTHNVDKKKKKKLKGNLIKEKNITDKKS